MKLEHSRSLTILLINDSVNSVCLILFLSFFSFSINIYFVIIKHDEMCTGGSICRISTN